MLKNQPILVIEMTEIICAVTSSTLVDFFVILINSFVYSLERNKTTVKYQSLNMLAFIEYKHGLELSNILFITV